MNLGSDTTYWRNLQPLKRLAVEQKYLYVYAKCEQQNMGRSKIERTKKHIEN